VAGSEYGWIWVFIGRRKRMMMVVVADSLGEVRSNGNVNQAKSIKIHILRLISFICNRVLEEESIHQSTTIIIIIIIIITSSSSFVCLANATNPFKSIYLELFLAPGSMPVKVVVVVMLSGYCAR